MSDIPDEIKAMLGKRVRVYSGAFSAIGNRLLMDEGVVIGYAPHPTVLVEHDDGTQAHWQVTLPIEVLPDGLCTHATTSDITLLPDRRRRLRCNQCGAELDGGPR